MAKSMTAYGRCTGNLNGKSITVEIKSVNSRYLDLQIKISKGYTYLEEKIKALVSGYITRGKVDVYVGIDITEDTGTKLVLDKAYTLSYIEALKALRDEFFLTDDISVMSVAQNKDIFIAKKSEDDIDKIWNDISPFITDALNSFDKARVTEGENLKTDLLEKKANIQKAVHEISSKSLDCTAAFHDKFESKIRKIIGDCGVVIDEQRILTECAIYTDKIAVDEELVRLDSHFMSFDEIFASDAPVGRKLDFLMQEMNREINTIGSKCSDADIAHIVVDVKCEFEKIREQIQNLE